MTLVSILTPCWNGQDFLHAYFQRILSQTHNEVELVFINDGSMDSSAAICESYRRSLAERGYRFVYLEQCNQGAATAIKNGLERATGEYLMLCDVDDKLAPSLVDAMSTFLDAHAEFGMVRCNGRYEIEGRPGRGGALFIDSKKEREQERIFESLLLGDTNNWPGSYMVRHKLLREQMGDEPMFTSQFGQNLQIMLPVALRYRSGFIDRPLMRYVVRQGSHSHPAGKHPTRQPSSVGATKKYDLGSCKDSRCRTMKEASINGS